MRACAIAAILLAQAACNRDADARIAITHVSIIDVVTGNRVPDMTVVISGNRIQLVAPAASADVPRGAKVVNGRGKFLIPGLWDMHVHSFVFDFASFAGPLMIANGVTGARDMGYYVDTTLRWKRDIAAGLETGPRLVAGVRVDGPNNDAGFIAHVETAEDGVRAVDTLAHGKDGSPRADFIKVYSWIPREAYFAIAGEAKKLTIPFAGHVPYSVTALEASDAGQRSIEHEDDLMRACSSRDSALRAVLFRSGSLSSKDMAAIVRGQAADMRRSFDSRKCQTVASALVRNHTWVTPTLVVYQPYAHAFDSASTHREWAKYVPGIVQGGWTRRAQATPASDSTTVRSYFSFARTGELRRAGVQLLAGTDAPQAFVYPGFSLHEELALLVEAGLTPLDALRAATYNPAQYLGALDSLGTVETGKVADLVLLAGDPLSDIHNTRRVDAVVANGRLFERAQLDSLLRLVVTAVKH